MSTPFCWFRFTAFALLGWLLTANATAAGQVCDDEARTESPPSRFIVLEQHSVEDTTTGLQWKRCSEGQDWSGGTCTGAALRLNWHQALAHAEGSSFAGHRDWRLPTREELASIVEPACVEPAIDLAVFPGTPSYAYWSATPFEYFVRLAWGVYFNSGRTGYSPRDFGYFHVRLVRDTD
ncbi:DUF1566 domain-containing protein [Thioalkalicoccus limnaeus]|uniref:DUF1566 domain-containing protein n=1 Tax=Thioalkalicoccus limnaeus TaxID=120681 RepID=A0ABV4BJ50_9GAMM